MLERHVNIDFEAASLCIGDLLCVKHPSTPDGYTLSCTDVRLRVS